QTNVDRAAHCVIRDSYKSGELIRILKSLWSSSADSDLRNLNFADCFYTIIPIKQHKGIQQALALVFSLDKGKTLKEGEVKFACAMRHENVFRCPFSAFAFFMFSVLQVNGDFLNEKRWHNWKVLRGRSSPEKSLSGGIPFDLIKRGGGWKDRLGRLETHYLGKLPSPFARGMAGFWEEPFSLARNTVSPSLELQRTIFSWIGSHFGVGNVEW
ncbi:hypothetical protein INT47_011749, partial [Mucor saturninus]